MTKNTKIALGLIAIASLFIAYKKGVFSKSETKDDSSSNDTEAQKSTASEVAKNVSTGAAPIVVTASSSETPQVAVVKATDSAVKMPSVTDGGVVTATGGANPFFSVM